MYVKRALVKVINISKNLTLLENISTYARVIMTTFIKKKDIKQNWLLIDGKNLVVGRLAVYISKVLRGKLKTTTNDCQTVSNDFIWHLKNPFILLFQQQLLIE